MVNVTVVNEEQVTFGTLLSWQISLEGVHFFSNSSKYCLFCNSSIEKSLPKGLNSTREALDSALKEYELNKNDVIIYPIYAYIHSGITLSLTTFSCPWDSGIMGYLVVEKNKLREFYGTKLTKKYIEKTEEALNYTIENYNKSIVEFVISIENDEIDESFAFYGESDYIYELQDDNSKLKDFILEHVNIEIKENEKINLIA